MHYILVEGMCIVQHILSSNYQTSFNLIFRKIVLKKFTLYEL